MGKLNIDQVAELAFVSRSVVSRVLNNRPNVSDDAKERVLDVVEKYNYQPSTVARSLATSRNYEIGILSPRRCDEALGNGFWSLLHLGIFEECIQKGYFLTLSPISTDKDATINEHILDDKRLDGYILLTQEITDFLVNKINERNIPMIMVGHDEQSKELSSIDVNNFSGMYKATNHLIELGHSQIGAIMADPHLKESTDRIKGYRQALNDALITPPEEYLSVGNYSQHHGYQAMKKWIDEGLEITAAVCMGDTLAMGALLALHQADIAVPEDFSIVGFDDLPFAQYTIPPLTTVKQPIYEKGKCAANLIVNQIENNNENIVHENLDPSLIIRESTGPVPN
jgi:LacI family transcriptional regulator